MHEHSFLFEPVNALLRTLLGGPPPVSRMSPAKAAFFFPAAAEGAWLPDHVIVALFLFLVLLATLPLLRKTFRKRNPNGFQNLNEVMIGAVRSLLDDVIGHGAADRFFPLIGAFTYFILISNLMGFFFFLAPPTSSYQTTLALALTSFVYYNAQGVREHGFWKYMKHFAGPVWWLALLFFPIEIIGNLARILSLSLRLGGNMWGEHTATGIFFSMAPILVPWPMMLLGIIGAILQTFIFVMLSIVYIYIATAHEEH